MGFMNWIIQELNDISSWFYEIYLKVYSWPWPFWEAAVFFYYLCSLFNDLAWNFYGFSGWVDDIAAKVVSILSWSTIWSYILSYVPNLTQIRDWFYSWWNNITSVVTSWWSAVQYTVQAWVQDAKNLATTLFNQANTWLATLQSAWDNFKGKIPSIDAIVAWWGNWWGNILGQLGTWWNSRVLDVLGLIDSAFLLREGFWSGWQEWKGKVAEFFTDPMGYIWERFTDWFLGPEG